MERALTPSTDVMIPFWRHLAATELTDLHAGDELPRSPTHRLSEWNPMTVPATSASKETSVGKFILILNRKKIVFNDCQ